MDGQIETSRTIPKNFRQIGEIESQFKIYIEDYVNTFMRKSEETGQTVVGAFLGEMEIRQDGRYIFITGLLLVNDYRIQDRQIVLTDEAWTGIFENRKNYFPNLEICGWYVCSREMTVCRDVSLLRMYSGGLHRHEQLIFVRDKCRDEDYLFISDNQGRQQIFGYYVFYERNEAMQEYMVTGALAVKTEPAVEDKAAVNFRSIMVEKEKVTGRQKTTGILYGACTAMTVVVLASGISMFNHFEKLSQMEAVLTGISVKMEGGQDEETTSEESDAAVVVELVPGGVKPQDEQQESSENMDEREGESNASEESPQSQESSDESRQPENGDAAGENQSDPELPAAASESGQSQDTVNASANNSNLYTVQKNDTLSTICRKSYGSESPDLIAEICRVNNLPNPNYIYEGQVLQIP